MVQGFNFSGLNTTNHLATLAIHWAEGKFVIALEKGSGRFLLRALTHLDRSALSGRLPRIIVRKRSIACYFGQTNLEKDKLHKNSGEGLGRILKSCVGDIVIDVPFYRRFTSSELLRC